MKTLSELKRLSREQQIIKWQESFHNEEAINDVLNYCGIHDIDEFLFESNVEETCKLFNRLSDGKPEYWFYQMLLYERLNDSLKTYDRMFIKLLNKIEGIEATPINDYTISIKFENELNDDFYSLLNFANYLIKKKESNVVEISARKPNKLDYNNKYAYHVTNSKYVNKILKNGLVPYDRTKFENHDARIYLWLFDELDKNKEWLMKSFGRLQNRLNNLDVNDVIMLKVDLDKFKQIKEGCKLVIYGDPSSNKKSAVFTLENIPPSCVEIYE